MSHSFDPARQPWLRRAVLAAALALGVAVAFSQTSAPLPAAYAADKAAEPAAPEAPAAKAAAPAAAPKAAASAAKAATPAAKPTTPAGKAAPADAASDNPAADASEPSSPDAASEVTIDHRGIGILKDGKRVRIEGFGSDREYDSFRDFVNDAPWLAALVFLLVLLFFLTPLLILVLVIWYKVRKTRMQNETMIKLAERGVVAPAEAMQTLAADAATRALPPSVQPLYEQARQLRRRVAWSDLRKGVILIAVGLGFIFYWMITEAEASWVGLVCLFLGIGYCVLWFFEDRHTGATPGGAGAPPAGSA